MTADGPLRSLGGPMSARQSRVRAAAAARRRRPARCAGCPAVLDLVARGSTRFAHCVSCAQTSAASQLSKRAGARGHKACAPRRLPRAPAAARTRLRSNRGGVRPPRPNATVVPERQAAAAGRAVRGAEQRSTAVGARQRASSTDSPHLSERSSRSERSELSGATAVRAAQGSRRNAPTAEPSPPGRCRLSRRAMPTSGMSHNPLSGVRHKQPKPQPDATSPASSLADV